MQLVFELPTHFRISLHGVLPFVALLRRVYRRGTQVSAVASFGGIFSPSIHYFHHSCYPQHWQNEFFDRTTLRSLGLVCHLGHNGDPCPIGPRPLNLTIIDVNGWHKVRVGFCGCDKSAPWRERYRQLLRMRWYPASFSRPRTAFSFDLLETYHKVALQGKLNLYDFYLTIMQKSDNQGRSKTIVSDQ